MWSRILRGPSRLGCADGCGRVFLEERRVGSGNPQPRPRDRQRRDGVDDRGPRTTACARDHRRGADRTYPGPDLKRFDHAALAGPTGAALFAARSADDLEEAFSRSVRQALDGQPTILTVPADLMSKPYPREPFQVELVRPEVPPTAASQAQLDEILALLRSARRPLILAGGGAARDGARQRLEVLAQRTGSLLGTTLVAKDLFRGHELDLGTVGGFSSDAAREVIRVADLLLAFGASLSSFTMGLHTSFRGIPIVHVDIDPAKLNANVPVDVAVVGDAAEVAGQLLDSLPPVPPQGRDFHQPTVLARLEAPLYEGDDLSTDTEIDPRVLALTLNEILPADATIVVDGGHHMAFSGAYVRVQDPAHFRTTTEFASVGMGFGTAIGAAVAAAGAPVILFIGDGGLLMTLGELETVERYRLPIAVVVMNDAAYGAERHFLDLDGLPHRTSQFPATDFAPIASALGLRSADPNRRRSARVRLARSRTGPVAARLQDSPRRESGLDRRARGGRERPEARVADGLGRGCRRRYPLPEAVTGRVQMLAYVWCSARRLLLKQPVGYFSSAVTAVQVCRAAQAGLQPYTHPSGGGTGVTRAGASGA